ncbi:MAG TPA: DUF2333 domain-containing protein [Moraxellaceae bacterium]|nr:DUF2333 domain-containing protein [Moraxellaceae bacterium]
MRLFLISLFYVRPGPGIQADLALMDGWQDKLGERWEAVQDRWAAWDVAPLLTVSLFLFMVFLSGLGWYWSREPDVMPIAANESGKRGQVLARALAQVSSALHDKPGGYLRNDLFPPGLLLDNLPAWELGVLQQVRGMTRALHRDMSLSHAQFIEDQDLAVAESAFNVKPESWLFPVAERELVRGSEAVESYRLRLGRGDAGFYAREAYLHRWLVDVDAGLGLLSTRLNAALPDHVSVLPVAGSARVPHLAKTGWLQIDDVFYEARGNAWALLHLLKAVEVEFGPELGRRQALLSLRAAIHELEATQQTLWSPAVLNGSGFGLFANHSLVMANYLNRAQTDLADVRRLLVESD